MNDSNLTWLESEQKFWYESYPRFLVWIGISVVLRFALDIAFALY